jgi:hypothetical protein
VTSALRLTLGLAAAATAAGLGAWVIARYRYRRRKSPEEIERLRRWDLNQQGRITVGTVIEEQRIMNLPLNGRSFFSLVALSPNVTYGFTPAAQAGNRLGGSRGNVTIAMTGARSTWSNYTLDGIPHTDIDFTTYILQPSVDALQEFKVQTGV